MRKKIFIGIGIFLLLVVIGMLYMNNRNRTLSPPGTTSASFEGLKVQVDYSRPSVRDRVIFGRETDGALVPHGTYWRLGANEPTSITVNQDFMFGDMTMPAGTYDIYAIPDEGRMKIRLNSGNRFWGYSEPDYEKDLAELTVPMKDSKVAVEQFTISAIGENGGVNIVFMWADKIWEVMIKAA